MDSLKIEGQIVDGCGRFRDEICLPRDLIPSSINWMETFVQGTLNIQFSQGELPQSLQENGLQGLDLNSDFEPAIYRSGSDIPNNTIQPSTQNPKKGDIQLWRARLFHHDTGENHRCFVIRRVESGYKDKAEILGEANFREEHDFRTGQRVSLTVLPGRRQS